MCGFPIAQMDKFMEKLVREHNKFVAICEEDKHFDKHGNLVKIVRKVVRVVTPGQCAGSVMKRCVSLASIKSQGLTHRFHSPPSRHARRRSFHREAEPQLPPRNRHAHHRQ